MQVIILRILSLLMSVIMFSSGLISGFFGLFDPYRKSYTALEDGYITDWGNGKFRIIESYEELLEVYSGDSDEIAEYDEEYFEEKSLLAVAVELPQTNYYAVIDSIEESGDTVTVKYHLESKGVGAAVLSSQALLIEVSKDISRLTLYKEDELIFDSVSEPVECVALVETWCFEAKNDKEVRIIHTYEEWQDVFTLDYDDRYTEDYFKSKSIVMISVIGPDSNYKPIVESAIEYNGVLDVIYKVEPLYPRYDYNTIGSCIFIETSKEIKSVNIDSTLTERPFYNHIDYLYPSYVTTDEKDGLVTFIRDYETYTKIVPSKSHRYYQYTNSFFNDYSLVLVTVATPHPDYYIKYSYSNVYENGNTLELNYWLEERDTVFSEEMVYYPCLLIQINKNITNVNINETSDKKHFNYFDADGFNLPEDFTSSVIHDFSSWSEIYDGTADELSKYNEEYFKNGSLAVIPVTLPDTNKKVRIRDLEENGSVLEVKSRIYKSDSENATKQIIIIETSKSISEIENETKEFKNNAYVYTYPVLSAEELKPISTYEEFLEAAGNNSIKDKYDEAFFEENSLIFTTVTLSDTSVTAKIDYAEENGNILDLGYLKTAVSSGGFAVICYQFILVEVSKNVEFVNVSYLKDY